MKKKGKKIFFISPVRLITPELEAKTREYVENLEKEGHKVHWPIRDTNQVDPTLGVNICDTNLKKIHESDEIHVWYMKESSGIHFDIGATYMLIRVLGYKKRVVFVNKDEFAKEIAEKNIKAFFRVLNFLDESTKEN